MALGMDKVGKRIAGTNAIGLIHLIFVDLDSGSDPALPCLEIPIGFTFLSFYLDKLKVQLHIQIKKD